MAESVLSSSILSVVQAVNEWIWSPWLAYLVVSLVRRIIRSRTAESLDRTIAGSVEVRVLSWSLRQEGVADGERHQLIVEVWRRTLA
jgi:hypothetical protein